MRCILAFAGLVIVYIDPTEPSSREGLTYGVLVYIAFMRRACCSWL